MLKYGTSLWNHLSAKPGKQIMSLEFPGIISLQIQSNHRRFWKLNLLLNYITFKVFLYPQIIFYYEQYEFQYPVAPNIQKKA